MITSFQFLPIQFEIPIEMDLGRKVGTEATNAVQSLQSRRLEEL